MSFTDSVGFLFVAWPWCGAPAALWIASSGRVVGPPLATETQTAKLRRTILGVGLLVVLSAGFPLTLVFIRPIRRWLDRQDWSDGLLVREHHWFVPVEGWRLWVGRLLVIGFALVALGLSIAEHAFWPMVIAAWMLAFAFAVLGPVRTASLLRSVQPSDADSHP